MPRRRTPKRRAYETDLTDAQWALIAPMIPDAEPGGRPRKATSREFVNAILYFLRAGMAWRLLPHDLPPWQTVYYYCAAGSARVYGAGSTTPWRRRIASVSAASRRRLRPSWTALRARVLAAVDGGLSCRRAAERFGVSPSSAIRWQALRRPSGGARSKPSGGDRPSHRTEADAGLIRAALDERPGASGCA